MTAIDDSYRCLAPDLPLGAHASPFHPDADLTPAGSSDLLVAFLQELDLEAATFVGNDTGGAFCQVLVAIEPDIIDRLVLIPCDTFDRFLPRLYRPLQWVAYSRWVTFIGVQSLRLGAVRRLADAPVTRTGIPPELTRAYVTPLYDDADVRRDFRKVFGGISTRYTNLAARSFPAFEDPGFVIWGTNGPVFTVEDGRRIASAFPDSRISEVAGTRAFVPEDKPDILVRLLREFLAETSCCA